MSGGEGRRETERGTTNREGGVGERGDREERMRGDVATDRKEETGQIERVGASSLVCPSHNEGLVLADNNWS